MIRVGYAYIGQSNAANPLDVVSWSPQVVCSRHRWNVNLLRTFRIRSMSQHPMFQPSRVHTLHFTMWRNYLCAGQAQSVFLVSIIGAPADITESLCLSGQEVLAAWSLTLLCFLRQVLGIFTNKDTFMQILKAPVFPLCHIGLPVHWERPQHHSFNWIRALQ